MSTYTSYIALLQTSSVSEEPNQPNSRETQNVTNDPVFNGPKAHAGDPGGTLPAQHVSLGSQTRRLQLCGTGRQAGRQAGRQTDRQTDRQTCRCREATYSPQRWLISGLTS